MRKPDPAFSAASLGDVLFGVLNIPDNASLRIAYSGGLDSGVLLHALATLRASSRLTVTAIHIDHGLNPQSEQWAMFCAEQCRLLDMPFVSRRIVVGDTRNEGPEAAARHARYAALGGMLKSGEFLVTAQHRNDQAETVLLQLLRGSGIAGHAAMPARSRFGNGTLLRPLLDFTRVDLHEYARSTGLRWIEDPSNGDSRLRRNYLRSEILPRLGHHWPDAVTTLARSAAHAAEAQVLLDEVAEADLARSRAGDRRYPWALSVATITGLTPARQRNLLRLWLRHQDIQAPGIRHLAVLQEQMRALPESRKSCVSWPGFRIWRYRDRLVVLPAGMLPDPALCAGWDMAKPFMNPGIGRLDVHLSSENGAPRLRALAPVHVRIRQGGEVLRLPGRTHRHVLKKLIQAAGIPPWERERLPLIYAGSKLVAVADRWVCAEYAAAANESGFRIVWEPFTVSTMTENRC